MGQVLFIHSNPDLRARIESESNGTAMVTDSTLKGLRMIASPEVPISAIYFDPTDAQYSGLRFLELGFLQRPATPIYFVSQELGEETIKLKTLANNSHVKRLFNGSESYQEMTADLEFSRKIGLRALPEKHNIPAGYFAVPITDFIQGKTYPFNVFIEADNTKKLGLFAAISGTVDVEYLNHALQKSPWLYVLESDIQLIREQLKANRKSFLNQESFPPAWKTAEVLFEAKSILNEFRKNGTTDQVIDQTLSLISDIFTLISDLSLQPNKSGMNHLIAKAKESDHAIAATTLSVLMCKHLKFGKDAVVEILGVAALLQDVSLYLSPFGDISVKPFEQLPHDAQAYYQQHPLISADLVAQAANLPDVTLQVIRQHHERKDKTGFPNHIGGLQLHPMAEILSLINSYLEFSKNTTQTSAKTIELLAGAVFPHYSERTVQALRSILAF